MSTQFVQHSNLEGPRAPATVILCETWAFEAAPKMPEHLKLVISSFLGALMPEKGDAQELANSAEQGFR
jgi:hypothetical protein